MEIKKTKLDKLLGFKYRNGSLDVGGEILLNEEDVIDIIQKIDKRKAIKLLRLYAEAIRGEEFYYYNPLP